MHTKHDKLTWNQVIEIIKEKNAGEEVASVKLLLGKRGEVNQLTDGFPIIDVGSQTLSGTLSVVIGLDPEDQEALAPLYLDDDGDAPENPYAYNPDSTLCQAASDAESDADA